MQSGKQFERLQREAAYKLRSRFHAQTLSVEIANAMEKSSLRRPEIFKLSKQLNQLKQEHQQGGYTNDHCRKIAARILDSFPSYSVDEDPQFVCSLRILRAAAYFRGPLLAQPPKSVILALHHHTAHTFLWDAPAAVGFVSVLPSLANTFGTNQRYGATLDESFGTGFIGSSGLVPDLARTMKLLTPRVYQLASQFTPTEALTIVAAYGTVDPSVATAPQQELSLYGSHPASANGLALTEFAPSPPIDFEAPDLNADGAPLTNSEGTYDTSSALQSPAASKTVIHALSTVSLMCEDHRNATEMCRFVYYSAALSPPVGAAHLLCLQPKLLEMVSALTVDDVVALCRCVSRTKRVSRKLLMSVGRRALLLLGDLSPSAIGDVLNAFQMANLRHEPLLRRCATRQLMLLEDQTPRSVSATLAALAHFGINDTLIFSALTRRVHKMDMDGTTYASLLHSTAKVGHVTPYLLSAGPLQWFVGKDRLRAEELTSNIAIVLWSCTKLMEMQTKAEVGSRPPEADILALIVLVEELLARFEARPAMAKAEGASEARITRQTMVIDGSACLIRLLEGSEGKRAELGTLLARKLLAALAH